MPITFDKSRLDRFNRSISRMMTEEGKSVEASAKAVAGYFVTSARAATPQARVMRRIVPNPDFAGPRSNTPRWAIEMFTSIEQPRLYPWGQPTSKKSDLKKLRLAKVPHRGLAKACWVAAGVRAKIKGKGHIAVSLASEATRMSAGGMRKKRDFVAYTITNRFSGIETLDRGGPRNPAYNILGTGFDRASNRLDHVMRQRREAMRKEWSK